MDKYEITMTELLRKLSDDYPAGYDFQVLRSAALAIISLQAEVKEYRSIINGNAKTDNTYTAIKAGWLNQ
jgi:hypothetical protein